MYKFDLFTTFYTIFQLELSKKKYKLIRNLPTNLRVLFFVQLGLGAFSIALRDELNILVMLSAIITSCITILISIFGYFRYVTVLGKSIWIAIDILDLDTVEIARVEKLCSELAHNIFDYPLIVFIMLLKFFLPFV
jgi:hypothetical protein